VHQAGQLSAVGEEPFTRILAAPPLPGADQQTIVQGFLNASASFDNDHEVAREFLTPAVARSWNPTAGAQVYYADTQQGGGSAWTSSPDKTTWLFKPSLAGTMSAQGAYSAVAPGTRLSAEFHLIQVGGQWRISALPAGLLLTTNDLTRAYRGFDIYFPNGSRTVVVPDQILVPVGPGQSTSLVRALLQGPTPWLNEAVRTAIPVGTQLVVDSVPVRDGVVYVDLTSPAANVSRAEADAMSAQFAWTLRQLPGVTTMRLTVEGVPLRVSGSSDVQSVLAWSRFDPDGGTADSQAYAVNAKGQAVVLRTSSGSSNPLQPVRGAFGDGNTTLLTVVPSFDGSQLAGLTPDRRHLMVSSTEANAKARPVLDGTSLTQPSWDRLGEVWVADRAGTTTKVYEVTPGSTPVAVQSKDLPKGTLSAFQLARDGVRVAVLMTDAAGVGHVYVGLVLRSDSKVSLTAFRPVTSTSDVDDVVDVVWASADHLAVLARQGTAPVQAWLVDLSSGSIEQGYGAPPTDASMVAIAAAPTRPVLVSTSDGTLWNYTGFGWSSLDKATFPAYPG
jgi:hypothetical protein